MAGNRAANPAIRFRNIVAMAYTSKSNPTIGAFGEVDDHRSRDGEDRPHPVDDADHLQAEWGAQTPQNRYMPVTARCTKVNMAMIKNRMIADMLQLRPAFDATPSNPPVPAKNKTT